VAAFAYQVCKYPMFLSQLEVLDLDGHEFCSTQTATKEHR
jgi:hypothetical protein